MVMMINTKNKNRRICRLYDYKFSSQKMPKEKATCKCLSIIMSDSVIKANKKYYPQTLSEECKYEQKIENLIDDELEKSETDDNFNDETEPDSDNDNDE